MSSTHNGVDLDKVHEVYQTLYNNLTTAYWAANTIQDKDRIHGVMDLVFETLSALNLDVLEANSAAFKLLSTKVKATNDQLTALKATIDKLIAAVTVATQVATAIDQTLALAAKFFAL
jgi:hypothetical protein